MTKELLFNIKMPITPQNLKARIYNALQADDYSHAITSASRQFHVSLIDVTTIESQAQQDLCQ